MKVAQKMTAERTSQFPQFQLRSLSAAIALAFAGAANATNATAVIDVDTTQVQRTIPQELYGTNIEWILAGDRINGTKGSTQGGGGDNWNGNTDTGCQWSPWGCPNPNSALQPQPAILPAVTVLGERMGIGTIRFPGGTYADGYNWHNGVSAGSGNPMSLATATSSISSPGTLRTVGVSTTLQGTNSGVYQNSIGIDDIVAYSQEIGAKPPIFQVSTGINPPNIDTDLATQWITYTNATSNSDRTSNGHPSPYGIHYWEIGNEPYYPGLSGSSSNGCHIPATPAGNTVCYPAWNASDYATATGLFTAALKGVDSSIKTIAAGTLDDGDYYDYGWYPNPKHNVWNTALLSALKAALNKNSPPPFDLIALHDTYAPNILANGPIPSDVWIKSTSDLYQAMWTLPQQLQQEYGDLEQAIAAAESDEGPVLLPNNVPLLQTKLAITEWGPLFSAGPSFVPGYAYYDFTKTLGSALYVASQLEVFLNDPNIVIANYFDLSSGAETGMITNPYAANCWYGTGRPGATGAIPSGCAGGPGPTTPAPGARLIDGTNEGNATASSNDDYYMEKPSGYVFQLFHQAFGTQLVATTSPNSDPSLFFNFPQCTAAACPSSPQGNLVSTKSPQYMMMPSNFVNQPISKLDTVSSLSDDGKTLYVMVVNRSLSTDTQIPATINLTGFKPQGTATVYVLGSTNSTMTLDDNNGVDVDFDFLKYVNPVGQPLVGKSPTAVSITTTPGTQITVSQSQVGAPWSFSYNFQPGTITSIQLTRSTS